MIAQGMIASEWQPIETAPKDGTDVLLLLARKNWRGDRRHVIGFWSQGDGERGDWFEGEADSTPITAFDNAVTHWMPLPDPPK